MSSTAKISHFLPVPLLRNFELNPSEKRSRASAKPAASDDTAPKRVSTYQIDEGKLVLQAEPESLVPPTKARCEDLGIEPTHDSFKKLDRDLSSLEAQGLSVIRTLIYAVSKSKFTVSITRRDINTLYRFLFVMWCRHSERGVQLASSQFDEQSRQALDQHLARNFDGKAAEPLDAWLQNLRQLLDDKLVNVFTDDKIFQQDRLAFENDCRLGRLAIWRSSPDVDFISSMNAFGVYDSFPVDAFSRHADGLAEAFSVRQDGLAVFARAKVFAIHPNVALAIIRPTANKGANQSMLDSLLSRGSSLFTEFPVYAPEIRYANLSPSARSAQRRGDAKGLEGRKSPEPKTGSSSLAVRIDGKMLEAREDDTLTLTPAQLSSRQTLLVNALVLHNAKGAVIFRSTQDLQYSLNAYINDFPTWNDKKDYSLLQEQLDYVQTGKPIPERLRLPSPVLTPRDDSIDDNAPVSDISRPVSPLALSDISRPDTPTSPTMGKRSRRQKKRDSMDRRSRLILSPPDSPLMSDNELPVDSPFGSPLSTSATLVESSPVMKSIDMVLSSPTELVKPLPHSLCLEPVVEISEKPVQEVVPQVEASSAEEVVVYPRGIHPPQALPDPGLLDVFEPTEASALLHDAAREEPPVLHIAPPADVDSKHSDSESELVPVTPISNHVSHHEPHAESTFEAPQASYDDPELEDYTGPPLERYGKLSPDHWAIEDSAHEDESVATPSEPVLDNVPAQSAASPLGEVHEVSDVDRAGPDESVAAPSEPVSDNVPAQCTASPLEEVHEVSEVDRAGPAESPVTHDSLAPAEPRAPTPVDLDQLAGRVEEGPNVGTATDLVAPVAAIVSGGSPVAQSGEKEGKRFEDSRVFALTSSHHNRSFSVSDRPDPVKAADAHLEGGKESGKAAGDLSMVAEFEEVLEEKAAPAAVVEKQAVDDVQPRSATSEWTWVQWIVAWAALFFVLLFVLPFLLVRLLKATVGLRLHWTGSGERPNTVQTVI